MKNNTITTLKEFIYLYSPYKSNIEIANLLDINIEYIESVKKEIINDIEKNLQTLKI
ncbi:hypothetical protein SAMN02745883_02018 [Caminicella sporogenes DSM 14501]|uniref:Uncharacterized protein n=1 Tax=Caminicella sporogenes DSM 14501 TaxID=1121266 RepID=A0A1M6SDK1_9FIRM|nr:hypothetical protein [Caminicella sporogenes]WIF95927.1 hypothetical protein QNI18_04790 [Caminicella sporogenes]SHK42729.1 hypothetical protein SAMN02745883_02018 [Caminicella sporogenes DSM 14501]